MQESVYIKCAMRTSCGSSLLRHRHLQPPPIARSAAIKALRRKSAKIIWVAGFSAIFRYSNTHLKMYSRRNTFILPKCFLKLHIHSIANCISINPLTCGLDLLHLFASASLLRVKCMVANGKQSSFSGDKLHKTCFIHDIFHRHSQLFSTVTHFAAAVNLSVQQFCALLMK